MLNDSNIVVEAFRLQILKISDIAKIFARNICKNDLLLFSGAVGTGKTEFSRLIIGARAKMEDINLNEVSSPTFSIVNRYEFKNCPIFHIDLYRIQSEEELFELGMPDLFDENITLLEWPEVLETIILSRYVKIFIKENVKFKDCRDLKIEFLGKGWDKLIDSLLADGYCKRKR